jgi:hypothetical protein
MTPIPGAAGRGPCPMGHGTASARLSSAPTTRSGHCKESPLHSQIGIEMGYHGEKQGKPIFARLGPGVPGADWAAAVAAAVVAGRCHFPHESLRSKQVVSFEGSASQKVAPPGVYDRSHRRCLFGGRCRCRHCRLWSWRLSHLCSWTCHWQCQPPNMGFLCFSRDIPFQSQSGNAGDPPCSARFASSAPRRARRKRCHGPWPTGWGSSCHPSSGRRG